MTRTQAPARIDLAAIADFPLGSARLRPSLREVAANGTIETLEPRVMQELVLLAQAAGRTVSRDEMVERCWGGTIVGEDAIQRCIGRLRKLADASGAFEIVTLSRVGYRLEVRGSPTNTMFEMKGRLGFHDRLNALSAAKDEVDELIKCIESYERQEAEYLFSDNATVPKLLEQVKQLRAELTAMDELRVRKAREPATDFAISTFWKMMHRIGGMPVPSPPLWTIDDGCSQRAQAVLRDLPSPPIAETPKVHAALDVVEKWCREVQALDCCDS